MSSCSSNSVKVDIEVNVSLFLGVFGWSYIDYKAGISDIDTPGDDVGGQQDIGIIVSESGHDIFFFFDSHFYFFAILIFFACDDAYF